MITAYCSKSQKIEAHDLSAAEALPSGVLWIDMLHPTREEEQRIEQMLGFEVPTRDDLKDIEPSSRLYVENDTIFMTASLVSHAETEAPVLTDIAFILSKNCLVTVRYAKPKSFDLFIAAICRGPDGMRDGTMMLAKLLETIIDRTAEIIEHAVAKIDIVSLHIFGQKRKKIRRPPDYLEGKLIDIAGHHRLVSKVRDSLMSLSRLMTFMHGLPALSKDENVKDVCRAVSHDIQSLSEHIGFVAGNISFLLDASLGLISIEQNAIIKIFSIAAVVFLPPTLVASIYGMNFEHMPELHFLYGYPSSLLLMVVSAIIPFFFFRWKGWL